MKKIISSPLVFLSGIIILISGGINAVVFLILFIIFKTSDTVPAFLATFLRNTIIELAQPLRIISILIPIVIGIIFLVASKKMKKPVKLFKWSVVSLILGIWFVFELNGGGVFGGITAGVIACLGGVFGLIAYTKEK